MKYILAKKAYMVGEEDAVFRFRHGGYNWPDDYIELVYAESPGKAKSGVCATGDDFLSLHCVRAKDSDLYHFEGGLKTLERIAVILRHREWGERLGAMAETEPNLEVYIYSGQWGCYWRSGYAGYTSDREKAGRYSAKDAWSAVSHCGPEKMIDLVPASA